MGNIKRIWNAITGTAIEGIETLHTVTRSGHNIAKAGEHYSKGIERKAKLASQINEQREIGDIINNLSDNSDGSDSSQALLDVMASLQSKVNEGVVKSIEAKAKAKQEELDKAE